MPLLVWSDSSPMARRGWGKKSSNFHVIKIRPALVEGADWVLLGTAFPTPADYLQPRDIHATITSDFKVDISYTFQQLATALVLHLPTSQCERNLVWEREAPLPLRFCNSTTKSVYYPFIYGFSGDLPELWRICGCNQSYCFSCGVVIAVDGVNRVAPFGPLNGTEQKAAARALNKCIFEHTTEILNRTLNCQRFRSFFHPLQKQMKAVWSPFTSLTHFNPAIHVIDEVMHHFYEGISNIVYFNSHLILHL